MNGKECRATRREIDESELNQMLSDQARSHVDSCASCRDFRAERTSLRKLVGSLEPVAAPGDFDLRLRARIVSERQGRAQLPFFLRLVVSTPAIAGAALVVILALSLVWFAQRNRSQSPATAVAPSREAPAVPDQNFASNKEAVTTQPAPQDLKPGSHPDREGRSAREVNSRFTPSVSARDYNFLPAESIRQIEQRAGEVSLSAPHKPMIVSMQDGRGATRRISLPPVSFGAQRLVDNRIPVSATNSRSW